MIVFYNEVFFWVDFVQNISVEVLDICYCMCNVYWNNILCFIGLIYMYMFFFFDLVSVVEKFYFLEKVLKDECVVLLIK